METTEKKRVEEDFSFESYVLNVKRFYVQIEGFKAIITGQKDDIDINVIKDSDCVDVRWAGPNERTRIEQAIIEGDVHAVSPLLADQSGGLYMNAHVYNIYGQELGDHPAIGMAYDDYWPDIDERVSQEVKPFRLTLEGHEVV